MYKDKEKQKEVQQIYFPDLHCCVEYQDADGQTLKACVSTIIPEELIDRRSNRNVRKTNRIGEKTNKGRISA